MKEMKLDRHEFNLLVNDILLDVKPVKLRISIANRLIEFFDKKQKRIAELEKQLKNAIVPKFKVGDKVYANTVDYWENNKPVRHTTEEKVEEIVFFYKLEGYWFKDWKKEEIFSTKEEAQTKLEELKGE